MILAFRKIFIYEKNNHVDVMAKMEGRRARMKQIVESDDLGDFFEKREHFNYAGVIDAEAVASHNQEYERLKEFTLNRRRSELDIIALILNIAMNGVRKSKIFHDANLSYTMYRKYLSYLVGIEFLKVKKGFYYTTEKGSKFLGHWNQITALL